MTDSLPEGLSLHPEFITLEEEAKLLAIIDQQPWNTEISRQTQHYGFRYVYATRTLEPAAAIPDWLTALGARIQSHLNLSAPWTQIIVNEYQPGQGIALHTDHVGLFGPVVASLSLGSATVMTFDMLNLHLQPRTLLAMGGEARYKSRHGIPARTADTIDGVVYPRSRRVSITFRTLKK